MTKDILKPTKNVYLFRCKEEPSYGYNSVCRFLTGQALSLDGHLKRRIRHTLENRESGLDFLYETKDGFAIEFGKGSEYKIAANRVCHLLDKEYGPAWGYKKLDKEVEIVEKHEMEPDVMEFLLQIGPFKFKSARSVVNKAKAGV